jgi:hypothetical protein
VAGKTVTVVVPDELQPGQVLAVRPRPALLPLASAHHPPGAAVMGRPRCEGQPALRGVVACSKGAVACSKGVVACSKGVVACSHPHPCPAFAAQSQADATLYYARHARHAQVTAPPKRKARPSDIVRKQRVIQAREDLRQRQLPSRGWADVDDPGGVMP